MTQQQQLQQRPLSPVLKRPGPGSGGDDGDDDRDHDHDLINLAKRFKYDDWNTSLKCPVCLEVPRQGPIYGCLNGHLLCSSCQPRVSRCPTCRNLTTNARQLVAERILKEMLEQSGNSKDKGGGEEDGEGQSLLKCQTCSFVGSDLRQTLEHESVCVHRMVACPGRHRGACRWTGKLHELIKHVVQNKCVQIVRRSGDGSYSSVIGDFNHAGLTVFGRAAMTHWKPVLLVSPEHIRVFVYLVMFRNLRGDWVLAARAYSGGDCRSKYTIRVRVESAREDESGSRSFVYEGGLLSHDATNKDVLESGDFMLLNDAHVKQLCKGNNTLFKYSAQILRKRQERKEEQDGEGEA